MKKLFGAVASLLLTATALFSCSGENDNDVFDSTTSECLITNIAMGSVPLPQHYTSSAGTDSVSTSYIVGSNYALFIDQLTETIYNVDSLPVGTDLGKLTFATLNYTGKRITIDDPETGEEITFSTTDSTDFSRPRKLKVYASDGTTSRTYTVRITAHTEQGDDFRWQKAGKNSYVAALTEQRALHIGGTTYVFGREGDDTPVVLTASSATPANWTRTPISLNTIDVRSVQAKNNLFYASAAGGIYVSSDGASWSAVSTEVPIDVLLAAGSTRLYARSGNTIVSSSDGTIWTTCALDASADFLPAKGICSICQPARSNSNSETILLGGQTASEAVIWSLTADLTNTYTYPWIFLSEDSEAQHRFPLVSNGAMTLYDGGVFFFGLTETSGLSACYKSTDGGRTWLSADFALPSTATPTSLSATVDDSNRLWVIMGGTGEVWTGRYNRLGWEESPIVFKTRKR